jgi:hypothetical protein
VRAGTADDEKVVFAVGRRNKHRPRRTLVYGDLDAYVPRHPAECVGERRGNLRDSGFDERRPPPRIPWRRDAIRTDGDQGATALASLCDCEPQRLIPAE